MLVLPIVPESPFFTKENVSYRNSSVTLCAEKMLTQFAKDKKFIGISVKLFVKDVLLMFWNLVLTQIPIFIIVDLRLWNSVVVL